MPGQALLTWSREVEGLPANSDSASRVVDALCFYVGLIGLFGSRVQTKVCRAAINIEHRLEFTLVPMNTKHPKLTAAVRFANVLLVHGV